MRDVKLGIKKDATHGANDEAKHGIEQEEKYGATIEEIFSVILVAKDDAKKEAKIGAIGSKNWHIFGTKHSANGMLKW